MPKLNSIRVINACFNDASDHYEDFTLPFYGESGTYTLCNGGGKSVLLMLLFQTVMPNCCLKSDAPFKDIFKGGDPSRTTHVLAEWILDKGSETQYVLTGFCAKKNSDDAENSDGVTYFNYIVPYNSPDDHPLSLQNIPLAHNEEGAFYASSFTETRSLLKNPLHKNGVWLGKINNQNEYYTELMVYKLVKLEWDIIRRVNPQENYLGTHFGEYKRSRTLVEEYLIPIIKDAMDIRHALTHGSEKTKVDDSEVLAKTLYQSRESLKTLRSKVNNRNQYIKLLEELEGMVRANDRLLEMYEQYEKNAYEAMQQTNAVESVLCQTEKELADLYDRLVILRQEVASKAGAFEWAILDKEWAEMMHAKKELDKRVQNAERFRRKTDDSKYQLNFARATNCYMDILDARYEIERDNTELANIKKSNEELFQERDNLGRRLYDLVSVEKDDCEKKFQDLSHEISDLTKQENGATSQEAVAKERAHNADSEIKRIKTDIDAKISEKHDLESELLLMPKHGDSLLFDVDKETAEKWLSEAKQQHESAESTYVANELDLAKYQLHLKGLLDELERLKKDQGERKSEFDQYCMELNGFGGLVRACGCEDVYGLARVLREQWETQYADVQDKLAKSIEISNRIRMVEQYGIQIPKTVEDALEALKERFEFAIMGTEYLKTLGEEERKRVLESAPMVAHAIVLAEDDFRAIKRSRSSLSIRIQDAAPLLIDINSLRTGKPLGVGDFYIPTREPVYFLEVLDRDKELNRLKKDLANTEELLSKAQNGLEYTNGCQENVHIFVGHYPVGEESRIKASIEETRERIQEHDALIIAYETERRRLNTEQEQIRDTVDQLSNGIRQCEEKLDVITRLFALENEIDILGKKMSEQETIHRAEEVKVLDARCLIEETRRKLRENASLRDSMIREVDAAQRLVTKYQPYAMKSSTMDRLDFTANLHGIFDGYHNALLEKVNNVENLEMGIQRNITLIQEKFIIIADTYEIPSDGLERESGLCRVSKETLNIFKEQYDISCIEHQESKDLEAIANNEYQGKLALYNDKRRNFDSRIIGEYTPPVELKAVLDYKSLLEDASRALNDKRIEVGKWEDIEKELVTRRNITKNNFERLKSILNVYYASHDRNGAGLAEVLMDVDHVVTMAKNLSEGKESLCDRFDKTKTRFLKNTEDLVISTTYRDVIGNDLKVPLTRLAADTMKKNLVEFVVSINDQLELAVKQIADLEKIESEMVDKAYAIAQMYRRYLERIPSLSKIKLEDGTRQVMVDINFTQCGHEEDRARIEIQTHIRELVRNIEDGDSSLSDINKSLTPKILVGKVLDMGKIAVTLNKIDSNCIKPGLWDHIKASDGQANAMYIIFLVTIVSFVRDIILDRKDYTSSKVVIVDNPFGATSGYTLWQKVYTILTINNIQLICPGHKIDPQVREFFGVNHVLGQLRTADNQSRQVVIKDTQARSDLKSLLHHEISESQLSFV